MAGGVETVLDLKALAATVAGDRRAFEGLAGRHRPTMLRFARALVPSDAAAEEVVQEALLSAYTHAGSFRGEGSVRAWLLTITRRSASRWRRAEPAVESLDDVPLATLGIAAGWGAPEASPEHLAALAEQADLLGRALARLPEGDRLVLTLRDVEGLSGEEVAEVLDLGLAATKTRVHRARLRLMAELRAAGGVHAGP